MTHHWLFTNVFGALFGDPMGVFHPCLSSFYTGHTIASVDDVCPHGSALTVKFKRNLQQEKLLLILMECCLSWFKPALSFLSFLYIINAVMRAAEMNPF